VYLELQQRLLTRIRALIQDQYNIELGPIAIEQPPDLKLGEFALPVAFELARKLRKAPKIIAAELASLLNNSLATAGLFLPLESQGTAQGLAISRFEAAGAGYLNVYLDRNCVASALAQFDVRPAPNSGLHVLVEHTSINPNKAAHVGHLRNAILGDTFVRILRANGQKVD